MRSIHKHRYALPDGLPSTLPQANNLTEYYHVSIGGIEIVNYHSVLCKVLLYSFYILRVYDYCTLLFMQ